MSGIANPLRQLPSMHSILDVAEFMIVEHMDTKQRDRYYSEAYRPDLNSDVVPAGFDDASQRASFAAMMAAADD